MAQQRLDHFDGKFCAKIQCEGFQYLLDRQGIFYFYRNDGYDSIDKISNVLAQVVRPLILNFLLNQETHDIKQWLQNDVTINPLDAPPGNISLIVNDEKDQNIGSIEFLNKKYSFTPGGFSTFVHAYATFNNESYLIQKIQQALGEVDQGWVLSNEAGDKKINFDSDGVAGWYENMDDALLKVMPSLFKRFFAALRAIPSDNEKQQLTSWKFVDQSDGSKGVVGLYKKSFVDNQGYHHHGILKTNTGFYSIRSHSKPNITWSLLNKTDTNDIINIDDKSEYKEAKNKLKEMIQESLGLTKDQYPVYDDITGNHIGTITLKNKAQDINTQQPIERAQVFMNQENWIIEEYLNEDNHWRMHNNNTKIIFFDHTGTANGSIENISRQQDIALLLNAFGIFYNEFTKQQAALPPAPPASAWGGLKSFASGAAQKLGGFFGIGTAAPQTGAAPTTPLAASGGSSAAGKKAPTLGAGANVVIGGEEKLEIPAAASPLQPLEKKLMPLKTAVNSLKEKLAAIRNKLAGLANKLGNITHTPVKEEIHGAGISHMAGKVAPAKLAHVDKKADEKDEIKIVPDINANDKKAIYISLVEGDIVAQFFNNYQRAAIVNAANSGLGGGSGVDTAIHTAAGWPELVAKNIANKKIFKGAGDAVITPSVNLVDTGKGNYIIHAVGPSSINPKVLASAYRSSLEIADLANNAQKITTGLAPKADEWTGLISIAFTAISTGIFGYDIELATPVALQMIINYLTTNRKTTNIREIRFVTFKQAAARAGKDLDYDVYKKELRASGDIVEVQAPNKDLAEIFKNLDTSSRDLAHYKPLLFKLK